jgi:UDP-N-acetylglucosamine 2-epimerase (non-hydrolysing)
MKIMTVLGTRPEIIRLSLIIEKLDQVADHVLVHTGQNYDSNLNEIFFKQLGIRDADYYLGAKGSFSEQVGIILSGCEKLMIEQRPDIFLVLGDTNSALSVIVAKRLGIPVYHMEAGNRCYDDRVPEEVNRRIIDHSSDVLLPYTERSRQNLLREGISGEHIYVTGNPINEVIQHYDYRIQQSMILEELQLKKKSFFLVTMHRQENVDVEQRLVNLVTSLNMLQKKYSIPVIVSAHPRTQNKLVQYGVKLDNPEVRFLPPFGLFDFIFLERSAFCVLSDSGTVQEECSIFGVPNVTIRDVTERPETLECGSNILSGADPQVILNCVDVVTKLKTKWSPPPEYLVENVSSAIVKILMGYLYRR